jgi:SAM-dependent methyltransferase
MNYTTIIIIAIVGIIIGYLLARRRKEGLTVWTNEKKEVNEISEKEVRLNVNLGEVGGGIMKNEEVVETYYDYAVSKILDKLPKSIKIADFGGAHGFLSKFIKNRLEKNGKTVDVVVIDENTKELAEADAKGLKTLKANIENISLEDKQDLIIMRFVLHYNSLEGINNILGNVKKSLKESGYFINQVNSGRDKNHVDMINNIVNMPSLGRVNKNRMNYLTKDEYLDISNKHGFVTEIFDKDINGKPLSWNWTLKDMFERSNGKFDKISESKKREYLENKNNFLNDTEKLIKEYQEKYNIDYVKYEGEDTNIEFHIPIFLSHL